MSVMLCKFCKSAVDTDDDPDSLYVIGHNDGDCVCVWCREDRKLPTEFDK